MCVCVCFLHTHTHTIIIHYTPLLLIINDLQIAQFLNLQNVTYFVKVRRSKIYSRTKFQSFTYGFGKQK